MACKSEDGSPHWEFAQTEDQNLRVALLNDTADWYHWGCTATSEAIANQLRQMADVVHSLPISRTYNLAEVPSDNRLFLTGSISPAFERANADVIELLTEADIVVVNGEGTLHGIRKASCNLLYLMLAAKRSLDKKVFVINHSMYPYSNSTSVAPLRRIVERTVASASLAAIPRVLGKLNLEFYRRTYNQIDGAAIREQVSFGIASKLRLQTRIVQSFDCLPLSVSEAVRRAARKQKSGRRIVLAARSDMPRTYVNAMANIAKHLQSEGFSLEIIGGAKAAACSDESLLQSALQENGIDVSLYTASSLDDWLTRIGSAAALVSGRFHHTIAAYIMEVPVVLLDAATPKLHSVALMLELPEPRYHLYYLNAANAKNVLIDIERCPIVSQNQGEAIMAAAMENFRFFA